MSAALLRASDELNAFVAWWLHELREAWAAARERLAPERSRPIIIDLSERRGELSDLQEIVAENAPANARATVLLPEPSVLKCELRLPPVAVRDIARVVGLQLERKLPLPQEQLYVDWRVREVLPDRSRIVDVIMARRTVVDHLREAIRARGWRPVAITSREADGKQQFNLLPSPTRRLSFAVGTRERYLAWSAGALIVVYVAVAAGKGWMERASVRDDLTQARAQTMEIKKQRAVLATESKPIALLDEVMRQPSAAEGLAAVSSAFPRDSWIYQADVRALATGVSMTLEGYAPSATSLLQGLESSGRLDAIELIEATSTGAGSASERVELKARMRGRATP
jgi:hypothetical protein